MKIISNRKNTKIFKQSLVTKNSEKSNITQIRLRLYMPQRYQHQPVISQLISKCGLIVNITGAILEKHTGDEGCFDVEIRGTVSQISCGLTYLESLNLKILGKPNVDGDSWYC
ncbi:NIL domain-containing protein [Fischerella sp. PCC 9605]|uniref:NIL domain-containing protein n=1 Tax=Fischerella sp. PCC 9605 TaxID=1173024 RepID=UPI0004B9EA46|nr:NIL domain-containing protein [Fischerella sp. PCC 9605]